MARAQYLTHARVVLPDQVLEDSALLIEGDRIVAIEPMSIGDAESIDLRGQILMPGMIDLHCDAIEKEAEPRKRVLFPLEFAVMQIDRRNAAAGITTPYHALSFANSDLGVRSNLTAAELVRSVRAFSSRSLVDNRIHCRYEITDPTATPVLCELIEEGVVDLLSVMDHSPGQGQFKTLESYIDYMMGNHAMKREEARMAAQTKVEARDSAPARVAALLALAEQNRVPTASHDDDSPHRVQAMHELGVRMSEFPINAETAAAAIARGLPTILGAPNVVRGGSQSGSMRAIDAIRAGTASCLCSDYQPSTLIAAAFIAAEAGGLGLSRASALVSANPAAACGLHDRGRIVPGMRADLLACTIDHDWPVVTHTWSAGRHVFSTRYPVNTL